ncbi:Uncharacterised protein [Yersinia kristensenii]|nr:Uncharacterised protein [Yersinia kristensenii]
MSISAFVPRFVNEQPVVLTGAAGNPVCRIDVSFRWNDYMRITQMRQTHIYKYHSHICYLFEL